MLQRFVGFAGWIAHFQSHSGIRDAAFDQDGESCSGAADNHAVHVAYISGTFPPVVTAPWNGYGAPIGVGHRCIPCLLITARRIKSNRRIGIAANCTCSGCKL